MKKRQNNKNMVNLEDFIDKFCGEIEEESAAIFAGAGLSVAAGHVDWKGLLKGLAKNLGLDIDKEHDLVSIAQYQCNVGIGGRHELNQTLINKFSKGHRVTENHRILARLPIKTYWTTNYDRLIEQSLDEAKKTSDVKYAVEHLTLTKPKRNAIVYKMHGDIEHPDNAVLTKDDYEKYHKNYGPFITALSGDLVSKTFLFIGFSFSDPNLDYILSRIRVAFDKKQRTHYCIFKNVNRDNMTKKEFEYAQLKQELFINDLRRFNINTILIDDYSKVTDILRSIENSFRQKTIFISGSANSYGNYSQDEAENFIYKVSQTLIENNYRIVSGFGLGVGSHVISGALEELYKNQRVPLHDQLILRPFPQGQIGGKQWDLYRKDMISYAGIAVFLFGNKIENGKSKLADGLRKEFEIAKESRLKLIPVGATGSMAEQLWKEVTENFNNYYPGENSQLKKLFLSLGNTKVTLSDHLETIIKIIKKLGEENFNVA